ncbi:MAG: hypothetical protein HN878_00515 [Candidatus Diapherotrites archaeon]|nr:hypothetical protein [Candidatus Diapherotrites archaeon]
MVDEKIINETVKRMLTSNIDEETIVSTLKDIGIEEAQAKEIIANVTSGKVVAKAPQKAEVVQTIPAVDADQKIETMQNEFAAQGEKTELHETATHTMLNDHADKLDEMNKKVEEVKKVVSNPTNVDASLKVKISEIEQKTIDISARTTAMMEIMEKILETNRQILTELKSK